MDFNEYQEETKKAAIYPSIGHPIIYPALGLAGESGEVLEKLKKIFRDGEGKISKEEAGALKKEIGDVLWYISQLAVELGFTLEDVAKTNVEKLRGRRERGTIHGAGDDR